MRGKMNYKTKRNIIIVAIVIALFLIASVSTYMYLRGNEETKAVSEINSMSENSNASQEQTAETGNAQNNEEQTSIEETTTEENTETETVADDTSVETTTTTETTPVSTATRTEVASTTQTATTTREETTEPQTTTETTIEETTTTGFTNTEGNVGSVYLSANLPTDTTAPALVVDTINEDGYSNTENPQIHATDKNPFEIIVKLNGTEVRRDQATQNEKGEYSSWFGINYLEDGAYEVTATDIAGNTKTINFTLDRTAPEIEVKYSTTEPTNHGVFVNLISNEPIQEIEGWRKISDTEYQKAYSSNYTQDVTVKGLAGNEKTVTITITNINKAD